MKYIYIIFLYWLCCALVQAEENKVKPSVLDKLEQKMQVIDDYYQQVNKKLNSPRSSNQHSTFVQPNSSRDPFSYTEQMYRNQPKQNGAQTANNKLASNALLLATTTAFTADGLPIMKYRGYAKSPTGEAIGILEVLGMGTYTVRVGDQIGLHEIVKELVLVVEGLSRNNIIIKTGKLGKKLVVQ
ncbi:MAG: hypothetical protein QF552_14805 [Litorilituus sp.]|jgi:hypothetical protein|nr:hypothetical protein [Litorilituus sp.]